MLMGSTFITRFIDVHLHLELQLLKASWKWILSELWLRKILRLTLIVTFMLLLCQSCRIHVLTPWCVWRQ